jgi:transketolase
MRNSFALELAAQAKIDPKIFLVSGDLGYSVLDSFVEEHPEKFLNIGINEQSAIGFCTGLASAGYNVFYYSIANFAVLRCFEQIRNDAVLHNARMTIVGVGSGFTYASAGYSHWAIEDFGAISTLEGINIYEPIDPPSTKAAVEKVVQTFGTKYLRLGKSTENISTKGVKIGSFYVFNPEITNVSIVITHGSLSTRIHELNEVNHLKVKIICCVEFPPKFSDILQDLETANRVIVIEENVHAGGLGSFLERYLLETGINVKYIWRGVENSHLTFAAGSEENVQSKFGLDSMSILKLIQNNKE